MPCIPWALSEGTPPTPSPGWGHRSLEPLTNLPSVLLHQGWYEPRAHASASWELSRIDRWGSLFLQTHLCPPDTPQWVPQKSLDFTGYWVPCSHEPKISVDAHQGPLSPPWPTVLTDFEMFSQGPSVLLHLVATPWRACGPAAPQGPLGNGDARPHFLWADTCSPYEWFSWYPPSLGRARTLPFPSNAGLPTALYTSYSLLD